MAGREPIDPAEALDKFFTVVREEALANPLFGRRLAEAVGFEVIYQGETALQVMDPVSVAMRGREKFFAIFSTFSEKDIRKIGEAKGLLEKPAKKAKGSKEPKVEHSQLVALLWDRAKERLDDTYPHKRHAAE